MWLLFLCGICRVCGCGWCSCVVFVECVVVADVLVWCLYGVWLWLVFMCGVCRVCGYGWCSCVAFVWCVVVAGVLVWCL